MINTINYFTFVALLLADYDVDIHHILKPPERQIKKKKEEEFLDTLIYSSQL